ncbi:MAG: polymer-forming cytoskeletal protein [Tumebacillaceae bacterium]
MERLQNIMVNGMGDVHGGSYNRVTMSGMGKVTGDVEANAIMLNGSGTLDGDVTVRELTVNGNGKVNGTLAAHELENNGNLAVNGGAEVGDLRNRGRLHVMGNVTGRDVATYGSLTVGGDVQAGSFKSRGMFEIGGNLHAKEVDVEVAGVSNLKEIVGEHVRVARMTTGWSGVMKLLSAFFPKFEDNLLRANRIEGTTLMLEQVQADKVSGRYVKIGPNCRIQRVEYTDQLIIDPNSIVLEQVKVDPETKPEEPILLP